MSEETKTIITVALLVFAAAAWIWPLALGIHLEQEARKKRNEPPQFDERQRLAQLRAGNRALYALLGLLIIWTILDHFGWFSWTGSILDMTLCGLILAWGVWASDASALMYCWMLLFWTNPSDSGPGVCDSRMPFIFSCVYVAVLTGLIIYKMRKRKSAEVEEAP